ncbi:MAG: S8 family serine peptidase, partial [Planctomycetota bacterium]
MSRASILTSLLVLLSAPDLALSARAPIPGDYAPNEILIKFRQPVASALEQQLGLKLSVDKFKLSVGLDELNARHRLKKIQPVFKDFKKNRQRLNALLKKDKATLTQKEKHILRRLKRAPKDAKVPDLSRIYKIELDLDPGDSLEKAVQAYNNHPDVEYAELNHIVSIHLAPGDPYYLIQWPLNNVGQDYPVTGGETASGTSDADIDAPEAWSIHAGTSDVIVAVLDTGVDYNHRDLQGNMWADANGCCGHDFINDDNDPMDDNGHGTHCS